MRPSFKHHFGRDRRGNVAMMYALALPAMLLGVGAAIDLIRAQQVRTELNAAADAAALAALTPGMMQQSRDTAQAAATNMFNGLIANISSLAPGAPPVVITVVPDATNSLQRDVTVTYVEYNQNIFASILGVSTIELGGTMTANAAQAANIDFYLLLDNSPSMALPATSDGITQMEKLTSQQDGGAGCAFACHQASVGNSDTAGNPYWNPNKPSQTCTGAPSGQRNDPNAGCQQMDDYEVAIKNNITLRIDALNTGVTDLMSDAAAAVQNSPSSTPPVYRFAAYSMDSSWQIDMTSSNNYNQLMALTTDYVSSWSSASKNFKLMEYYLNNAQCSDAACDGNGGGGDWATDYDNALTTMYNIIPNKPAGQGSNVKGDTPQEVLFFVTDGVEDEYTTTCSQSLSGGDRCQAPINPTLCTTIKNQGIRIAILYTDYYQVTADAWYVDWIAPFQSQIASQLESCASPNLFYDAGVDSSNIGSDLNALFNTVIQTAHLTN